MSKSNVSNTTSDSIFGEVIHSYTRAQALEDGVLVDAGPIAQEAGFKWPVALTSAAWEDCVAWSDADSKTQIVHQDQSGRLWDVLWMAFCAIRTSKKSEPSDQMMFRLYRVPRDGRSMDPELVTLKLVAGPDDSGKPVITIMEPHED